MRQLASMLGMTELALADVHPSGQRCAVGLSLGCGQVTHARIVIRNDPVPAGHVAGAVTNERPAGNEPLQPRLDVLREPLLSDVVPVLVMSEIEAAAQAAACVAELPVLGAGIR